MDLALALRWSGCRVLASRPRQGKAASRRFTGALAAKSANEPNNCYDVVLVGGGFAGLAAVGRLAKQRVHGRKLRLLLIEQGRGLGGRVCTRRRETTEGPLAFDHGCQYFTAKTSQPHFSDACRMWQDAGVAGAWHAAVGKLSLQGIGMEDAIFEPFDQSKVPLVGIPSMSAIGKHIIREAQDGQNDVDVLTSSKASDAAWDDASHLWTLQVNSEPVKTSVLAVTTSARSCVRMLGDACPSGCEASKVKSNVCWALLVASFKPLTCQPDWDAALVDGSSCFAWVSRNTSKPSRPKPPAPECFVLHTCPEWSNPRAELSKDEVRKLLLMEFCRQFGCQNEAVVYAEAFRWNNAFPLNPLQLPKKCIVEPERKLVAGGDWASGDRVGDAFESGVAVAVAVLTLLNA
ncbi:unnamed protein product [Symbiodinium pilosum]|uniref:Amine oxidase domain-containing protein n=1 Tax=Symbiodinium pilosum TaxID=2952 RepID=A0A812RRL1_SYMPI|nr:unnamed protein product [Symbiodinium pilosum]